MMNKKVIKTFKVVRKKETKEQQIKEQENFDKQQVELDSYLSYYELFKSLSK